MHWPWICLITSFLSLRIKDLKNGIQMNVNIKLIQNNMKSHLFWKLGGKYSYFFIDAWCPQPQPRNYKRGAVCWCMSSKRQPAVDWAVARDERCSFLLKTKLHLQVTMSQNPNTYNGVTVEKLDRIFDRNHHVRVGAYNLCPEIMIFKNFSLVLIYRYCESSSKKL